MADQKSHRDKIKDQSEDACSSYKLDFIMSADEAYEAFYMLSSKWSEKKRYVIVALVLIVGIVALVLQFLNPAAIQYSIFVFISAGLFIVILYRPHAKANKGTKAVVTAGGKFKFNLNFDGTVTDNSGVRIPIRGDKDARAAEGKNVFALRPDRVHIFCLPKRLFTESECSYIRDLLIDELGKKHFLIKN